MEKRRIQRLSVVAISAFVFAFFLNMANAEAKDKIQSGSQVIVEYTLEADGKIITRNEDMKLVVGDNVYPTAYEKQLIGLKEGDKKIVKLKPEEAFGPERPELLKRIPKGQLPANINFSEGQILGGKNGQRAMRVVKILDDSVVFDQNHPLAGRNLVYNIRVKSVN